MTFRFYTPTPLAELDAEFKLSDDIFHHAVNVLRLRINDELIVFDGIGHSATARLSQVEKKSAHAVLIQTHNVNLESPLNITLAQCLSVGDKMDWTIEKAVELGVQRIVPLFSSKSQIKLSPERAVKKYEHWQRIIVAACTQSGRNVLPIIEAPQSINSYLRQPNDAYKLTLHPHAATALKTLCPPQPNQEIRLLIGPEAGLDEKEIMTAQAAGYMTTLLGPRILRTESAGLATIAALQALWGDF